MLRKISQALSLLAVCLATVAWADEPVRIRVVSYNIHHGEGTDGKLDLSRIAKVIADAKADIVALQEVDQKTNRAEHVDQAAELARLLDMHQVFGGNIDFQGGRYGNAVLTRHSSTLATNHKLPQVRPGEQRGVMEVDILVPGIDQPLKFLATHFDYRPDEEERIASCELIAKLSQSWTNRPALLAGDLNALPNSKTLELLQQKWTRANKDVAATFPSDKPKRQIDYILYRPKSAWKVIEFQVLEEPIASDHRGIVAVLEWIGNEG